MPEAAIVGVDKVGSGLITTGSTTAFFGGQAVALVGSQVAPHGSSPHDAATVTTGSSTVFIGGIAVARKGDQASCGDVVASGSGNLIIG